MLSTIILQPYKRSERKNVVSALDNLCSPKDNYGWASAGIYAYWNYYTNEILYLGLAIDLTERFKQHNGFYSGIDRKTCKYDQIEEYFKNNEKIGFSIIVQSPICQPVTHKFRQEYKDFLEKFSPIENYISTGGAEAIKHQEGVLIEASKQKNGGIPVWNKMNGSISGQKSAKPINYEALRVLSNQRDHLLLAKSSLFEISNNPTFERYEGFLHAVRALAPLFGESRAIAHLRSPSYNDTYSQMCHCDYLSKKADI